MSEISRPRLIQRCILTEEKLTYEYMGSNEFEFGEPTKSLQRILLQGIVTHSFNVEINEVGKTIKFFLVAGKYFHFSEYKPFIEELSSKNRHSTVEPPYLDEVIRDNLGMEKSFLSPNVKTNAWFDIGNDVFIVLSFQGQSMLVKILESKKLEWHNRVPDPPELKKFKLQLRRVNGRLKRAGKSGLILRNDCIEKRDGEYRAWVNPDKPQLYDSGWFTIQELQSWSRNRGSIMKKRT